MKLGEPCYNQSSVYDRMGTKEGIFEKGVFILDISKLKSSDKLGTMPMGRLILQMSIPLMISMILQAGYNLVDSIFVARLNEDALTAVSLSFPIQIAMIGLSVGTSVGVGALTSRRFGEKNEEGASNVAKTGIVLATLSWLVMAVFVFFFSDGFVKGQIENERVINYAISYLKIVGVINLGIFQQILMERLLQSTGKTVLSMVSQISGVVVNLILDPILIFGLFGAPRLEVAGAAIATVSGQIFGMLMGIVFNLLFNKELNLSFKGFKWNPTLVKEIYKIGVPSIVIQVLGSVMVFTINKILFGITSTAVAVFGAYFKINGFVFMPVFAMHSALTPIISYNFGAGNSERIKEAVRTGVKISISIMATGSLIFLIFPRYLLMMFNPTEEFLRIGIPALRIFSTIFMMAGYGITMSALFQSVGRPYYSLLISVLRQIVILLPTAYFMSKAFGLYGVWFSFTISELVTLLMAILFYKEVKKSILSNLKNRAVNT